MALITGVVVAGVVLGVVLARSGGTSGTASGGELFLQAANRPGPDPFTESTAKDSSTTPVTPAANAPESANVTRGVSGSTPGLYGGTRNTASCDVEKQVKALQAEPAKNKAFASVEGVQPSAVPAYLRSLTPVQLRMDTRVTNHGYRGGAATDYQAVLQTGTAVLVDGHGVPRVRCACGNPLTPAVAQRTVPRRTGDTWASYRSQNVVVVLPATTTIDVFVIYDPQADEWVGRHRGDSDGRRDEKTYPPGEAVPRGERVVGVTEASGIEVTGIGVSVPFGPVVVRCVVVRCVVAVHLFVIGSGVPLLRTCHDGGHLVVLRRAGVGPDASWVLRRPQPVRTTRA
ncbi:DUF6777 domain-containing protein [Streptomyces mirabilis]|uniref:DUF6777 domain-containing protein n=1 Tax=Streptomyces mirabilis TaxID=68239 RepID=A0ABU3V1U1_9ACTN|nr:DUF6777 domain-containing protein [Streptomyces mirabilis]MCX5346934.1 hypothetical protein [Streptomyces mirabilis]MDU8999729.1 hypothetical protein [Streptomyces mirabilis]